MNRKFDAEKLRVQNKEELEVNGEEEEIVKSYSVVFEKSPGES